MNNRPYRWLAFIVALGLLLRLLPLLAHGSSLPLFMDFDSWGYHHLAVNLFEGHSYSWETAPPYSTNIYRPPVLPVLLLGLYQLFGVNPSAFIIPQALLASATILLTYALVNALTRDTRLSLISAAILAIDPLGIIYSNLLLTEVYTSFLVMLVMVLVVRYLQSGASRSLIAAGAVLGLGILVHPVLLFLPPLLLVFPVLSAQTRQIRSLAPAGLALCLAVLPASAWIVRNAIVADYPGISCVSAVNLLRYKAAGVLAELSGTTREQERDRLAAECEALLPADATPGMRFQLWQQRGLAILREHPLNYAKIHARGCAVELIGPERDNVSRFLYGTDSIGADGVVSDASIAAARSRNGTSSVVAIRYAILALQGALLVSAILGIVRLIQQGRWSLLFAFLFVPAYILLLTGGPEASPRFRVIYLPMLSALSATGLLAIIVWGREKISSFGLDRFAWVPIAACPQVPSLPRRTGSKLPVAPNWKE